MKKLLIILLCIGLILPANVFAASRVTIGFDKAERSESTAVLPMYISDIPDGLTNISALTFHFMFDTSVLKFVGLNDGAISPISPWYNLSSKTDGKVVVSWYDKSATNENALTSDNIGKNKPVFYAEFEILDADVPSTSIEIKDISVYDYSSNAADMSKIDTIAGAIVLSAYKEEEDNSDDGDYSEEENTPENGDESDENVGGDDNATEDDSNTSSGGDAGAIIRPSTGGGGGGGGSSSSSSTSDKKEDKKEETPAETVPEIPAEPAKPVVSNASSIFSDVADSHWAAKSVVKLYEMGIVSGDNQKRANLDNRITRAETSKLALLVSGKEIKTGLALDVKDSSEVPDWAKDFMATAISEGVFSGYEDGTIKPKNNITRAEMVAVIIKALGIEVAAEPALAFADNDSISWAAPYVAKAVELGFVNGYEDNTFLPANYITRAEAFAVFARVADYLGK